MFAVSDALSAVASAASAADEVGPSDVEPLAVALEGQRESFLESVSVYGSPPIESSRLRTPSSFVVIRSTSRATAQAGQTQPLDDPVDRRARFANSCASSASVVRPPRRTTRPLTTTVSALGP
jgi:hypothetical protein